MPKEAKKVPNEKTRDALELRKAGKLLHAVRQSLTPGPASVPGYKPLTLIEILQNLDEVSRIIDNAAP